MKILMERHNECKFYALDRFMYYSYGIVIKIIFNTITKNRTDTKSGWKNQSKLKNDPLIVPSNI